MTVSEIAQKACEQLNLQDTYSLSKAKQFVRDRWQTIWNSHLWKDSVGYVSANAEMEEGRCLLRVPLERIRNIRCGQYSISPVDPSNVFQLDPQAFDSYGEVVAFSELGKDGEGNRIAQIYRLPREISDEKFLVMGKKKCPELADDDYPFLTGIDDALWEFVTGDLWKMDQQFQKANACYANGSTFVEAMRKIDGEQSAAMPRIIPDPSGDWSGRDLFED